MSLALQMRDMEAEKQYEEEADTLGEAAVEDLAQALVAIARELRWRERTSGTDPLADFLDG